MKKELQLGKIMVVSNTTDDQNIENNNRMKIRYYRDDKLAVIYLPDGTHIAIVDSVVHVLPNVGTSQYIKEMEVDTATPFEEILKILPITARDYAESWGTSETVVTDFFAK